MRVRGTHCCQIMLGKLKGGRGGRGGNWLRRITRMEMRMVSRIFSRNWERRQQETTSIDVESRLYIYNYLCGQLFMRITLCYELLEKRIAALLIKSITRARAILMRVMSEQLHFMHYALYTCTFFPPFFSFFYFFFFMEEKANKGHGQSMRDRK